MHGRVNSIATGRFTLTAAAAILWSGCWTPPRAVPALPAPLPAEGAAVAANSYPAERAPDVPLEAWRIQAGRGFNAAPRVSGPVLVASHTGREITVRETSDGGVYWRRRFSNPITALTTVGDVVYFAERGTGESRTHAIALHSAEDLWEGRIRRARFAPIALDSLIVFSNDAGELRAHAQHDGRQLWQVALEATLAVPPFRTQDGIAAATISDTLFVLDSAGGVLSRTPLGATPSAPVYTGRLGLAVPLHDGTVALLASAQNVSAHVDVGDVVLAQPVPGRANDIVVLTRGGGLRRIAGGTSSLIAELPGAATGSLSRVGDVYVIGLLNGTVFAVDDTGAIRWQHEVGESIDEPVVADAGALYVTTRRGTLIKLVER